jgi:hypothetical protein
MAPGKIEKREAPTIWPGGQTVGFISSGAPLQALSLSTANKKNFREMM